MEQVLNFGGEVGFITDSNPERESFSLYGQGTYNLTDRLRLIAGLRYTKDEVHSEVTNFFGRAGTAVLEIKGNKVTGRGALEYDLGESTLLYASYTSGFKPGGSNQTYGREDVIAPIVVLPTYEDETVQAWELGVKTDFAGGRARINVAAFLYDYENLQYQATDPEVFEGGVGNVPRSEIYGAELEFSAFITDAFALDAACPGWRRRSPRATSPWTTCTRTRSPTPCWSKGRISSTRNPASPGRRHHGRQGQ